jgi:hypothetical protein
MRRAAKTDGTHSAIRDHLRAAGWSVHDTAPVGGGFPDLVCARRGFTALVECKNGTLSPSRRNLNPGQVSFVSKWKGVCIKAVSPEDAERQLDLAEKYQYLRCAGYQA